jgi:acetylserotonin O-methyltransferase
MFAAVKLGVFDALSSGPLPLKAITKVVKYKDRDNPEPVSVNEDALERLLDACVGLELLDYKEGKYNEGEYRNSTVAATYLCANSPFRITGYINYSNDAFWYLWGNLEKAIRDNKHQWAETFKTTGPVFDSFYRTPEDMKEFLMGMHGYGLITSPRFVEAFSLSSFKRLVDLGGGTGHLAIAACRKYPELQATVFELPKAASIALEVIGEAKDVAKRIKVETGDFFKDKLPKADLYALARIIHDWPEKEVEKLLRKVFDAIEDGGAILIGEKILNENKRGPYWAQMQHLNMLAVADGRERTFDEYQKLLQAAGFISVAAAFTDGPLDFIRADKPGGKRKYVIRVEPAEPEANNGNEIARVPFEQEAEMYFSFFEDAPIGFVISRMNGQLILVNKAYADILQLSVEETLLRNYQSFTPKGYEEDNAHWMTTLRETGHSGPLEKQYIRKDGTLVSVRMTLHLMNLDIRFGYALQLLPSLKSEHEITAVGRNLVVIALVNNLMYFRIFDAAGTLVESSDEKTLVGREQRIEGFKKQLKDLWGKNLGESEKGRVIREVASIVGLAHENYIWSIVEEIGDQSGINSKGGRIVEYRQG